MPSQGAAVPTPRTDAEPRRRRRIVAIVLCAALALVVAVEAVRRFVLPHPAEQVLTAFFTALEDEDAGAALDLLAAGEVTAVPQAAFQTREALGGDWSLEGVDLVRTRSDVAEVKAEFSTPEGPHEGRYLLEDEDRTGTWTILDPFVRVRVEHSEAFEYLQVNDAVAAFDDSAPLVLFPGVYRFYQDVPGLIETADAEPAALFDPAADPAVIGTPAATVETEGTAAVQRLVDDRIATCLESAFPDPRGCPFGLLDSTPVTTDEGVFTFFDEASWHLGSAPAITVADHPAGSTDPFTIEAPAADHTVALTVRGHGAGIAAELTLTCTFDFTNWRPYLSAADGAPAFTVGPESYDARVPRTTCEP